MLELYCKVVAYLKAEDGVTAIEYGLIATLVAVALIAGAYALGGSLNNTFQTLSTKIHG